MKSVNNILGRLVYTQADKLKKPLTDRRTTHRQVDRQGKKIYTSLLSWQPPPLPPMSVLAAMEEKKWRNVRENLIARSVICTV